MERQEQVEKSVNSEKHETSSVLFEAAASRPAAINLEKESQKVADLFDLHKTKGYEHYTETVVKATDRLSSDLQRLAGTPDYNKLLDKVADKTPDEPACTPFVQFRKSNGDIIAGAKDAAAIAVVAGDSLDAYRIVQPGNTFNQIVKETYAGYVKAADGAQNFMDYDTFRKSVVDLNKNKIADPNHLEVGQAIRLRKDFTWS